jgi:galactoside O-acetyltransferase
MSKEVKTSFYSKEELEDLGFKYIGKDVKVSRYARIYKTEVISIGDYSRIDDFAILSGGKGITIGRFCHIGCYCGIFAGAGVEFGDFSGVSGGACVYSESDDFSGKSMCGPAVPIEFKKRYKSKPVVFGRHAFAGPQSVILPGVTLADGVVIAPHSLVTRPCRKPWGRYIGSPAKHFADRSDKMLELEKEFLKTVEN